MADKLKRKVVATGAIRRIEIEIPKGVKDSIAENLQRRKLAPSWSIRFWKKRHAL